MKKVDSQMHRHMQHKIEFLTLDELAPYSKNSRLHSEEQVDQIVASIHEFGFTNPILIDGKNGIIAGHGRFEAATRMGIEKVPCVRLDHLSEAQKRAYIIADNKLALNATWDDSILAEELMLLKEDDFDLEVVGFSDEELADLLPPEVEEGSGGSGDEDKVPEIEQNVHGVKEGDVWQLGKHRLICGDSTSTEVLANLCGDTKVDLWITDPPYNVNYEGGTGLKIQNDNMDDSSFRKFLAEAYKAADSVMKPGAVFYVWHADSEGYNFRGACYDAGWKVRQCLIWKKSSLVLGRQDYHWIHEPCQPAGTMVRTPNGEVPIESLKDGDKVVSFNKYSGNLVGLTEGIPVKAASRKYNGNMYSVVVSGLTTKATDGHRFSVRFCPDVEGQFCTYLMKRGDWWRIGITSTYNARGFGLKHRMRQEDADAAWILSTHENKREATLYETNLSLRFGIPTTHWEPERGFKERSYMARDKEYIDQLYEMLNLDVLNKNAINLLSLHGRLEKYPLITKETTNNKFSRRVTCEIHACNLIPHLMQVPIPYKSWEGYKTFDWKTIDSILFEEYSGLVYSLDVEKHKHYIADGIVTHNCLYGWKDGAAHVWNNDRKQTTVFEFDKPARNGEHPTMKPVGLIEYQMLNSTKTGAAILDSFGGSGTSLIAAEKNQRTAFLCELDPHYCSVIISRWQEFSGKEARKIEKESS